MKLLLQRRFKGEEYTIGDLFIDGEFFSNTLEDTVRDLPATCPNTSKWKSCECPEKVYGKTAIPPGIYRVTMEYSPRFKRDLPRIHDVPHFLGILMHSGNLADHSEGCPLVGFNRVKGQVVDSRATSDKLNAILSKESDITIEVI